MRDEFLATLSHELRSPLSAVIGWTHILKNTVPGPDLIATAVDVIERNARLQARVVTDLLDISRAISGNLHLEVQDVDITEVIGAAIDSVAPTAAAKGIAITTTLDPINQSVRGDPARIQQMLWNLLSNALKFSPGGGQVEVVTDADDRCLSIRVSDNGEGIDPAFLPHLFERFRPADASSSRRHEGLGLGLGLAIVKQFAELQGGRVSAMSDGPGRGATFVLELPRGGVHSRLATTASQTIAAPSIPSQSELGGVSVLVVDDQRDAVLVSAVFAFEPHGQVRDRGACSGDARDIASGRLRATNLSPSTAESGRSETMANG